MIGKAVDSLMEGLYAAAIFFVYYYIFATLIQLHPFSCGFHPPTDLKQLGIVFATMLSGVCLFKFTLYLAHLAVETDRPEKKVYYIPANRKSI